MGTILLVDDNPLRAAMRTSILEDASSLSIVRVQRAAEALCLIEDGEFARDLSLVIAADLSMEKSSLSEFDFVVEIRDRLNQVPVLVLGLPLGIEANLAGLRGVYTSRTKSPQELRSLVARLIRMRELRYA